MKKLSGIITLVSLLFLIPLYAYAQIKDKNGKEWKVIWHLNGDQTHQGSHVRIFLDNYSILRFELYNYD